MSRPARVLILCSSLAAVAGTVAACGTQKISVSRSDPTYRGALLFKERCSGCHTLSYASAGGSATNVRTRELVNGPNFNVRCERPVTRVLYAIENGGFSGAIMPQNVVVGQDATEVAQFVAKYAGRQAPRIVGQQTCSQQTIGTLPPPGSTQTPSASGASATGAATGGGSRNAANAPTSFKPKGTKK